MAPVPLREFGGRAPSLRGSQEASSALIEGSRAAPHRPHRFLDGGFQLKQGKKLKNRKKKNRCQGSSRKGTTGGCDGTWYGLTTGGAHTPEARAATAQTHPCFRTKKKKKNPIFNPNPTPRARPSAPGRGPFKPARHGKGGAPPAALSHSPSVRRGCRPRGAFKGWPTWQQQQPSGAARPGPALSFPPLPLSPASPLCQAGPPGA